MKEEKIYWRDKVTGILQWGVALFLLLVGWSLDKHDKFELRNVSLPEDKQKIFLAICLIAFGVVYSVILVFLIRSIYSRFLNEKSELDETVLPRRFAMACAYGLAALTLYMCLAIAIG